jgi:secreted Zn-dependent insulinase-like peptidase
MYHLVALAKQKVDMFNSLREETNHYWSEIRDGRYLWDVDRQEVICLKSFTKEETLKAYDEWLSPQGKTRRRMAIQVISSDGDASAGRPEVADYLDVSEYNDSCVKAFQNNHCKNQTYGRIY